MNSNLSNDNSCCKTERGFCEWVCCGQKLLLVFQNSFPSPRNMLPMIKTRKTELLQESPHENIWQGTKKWGLDYKEKIGINFIIRFSDLKDIYLLIIPNKNFKTNKNEITKSLKV